MPYALSRREFFQRAALATSAVAVATRWSACDAAPVRRSPNEKLNLAVIGVAARAAANLAGVASENIVALCDIDSERLQVAANKFPRAETYRDFRRLLDRTDLDAVVVSTPDHTHAISTVWALQRGLDVYCEKPLAHSVHETRVMRRWAAKQQAVTQMGTQIHASDNYRRVVELIRAGVIGPVTQVHVWKDGAIKPGKRATAGTPPEHVDYDLWTGPAPLRPFDVSHFHFNWRYWWDYGNGQLGDFGCHYMDLPFWALDLRAPSYIQARGEKTSDGDNDVPDNMQVDYEFPARGNQPPVQLHWYHGQWKPAGAEAYKKGSAVLFEGETGRLLADYSTRQLFLEPGLAAETPEPSITASVGHHREWIEACKTRGPTTCNFDYSGALTEAVLLGNVCYRAGGERIAWHADELTTSSSTADRFLQREYRAGWKLEG